jgi:hypothetical protein
MEFRFGHPWLLLLLLILPALWVWQQLAAPAAVKYAPARFFEHGLKLRRRRLSAPGPGKASIRGG